MQHMGALRTLVVGMVSSRIFRLAEEHGRGHAAHKRGASKIFAWDKYTPKLFGFRKRLPCPTSDCGHEFIPESSYSVLIEFK
jgi:hypothetical protein